MPNKTDHSDLGFVPDTQDSAPHADLGFVPDHSDVGFTPDIQAKGPKFQYSQDATNTGDGGPGLYNADPKAKPVPDQSLSLPELQNKYVGVGQADKDIEQTGENFKAGLRNNITARVFDAFAPDKDTQLLAGTRGSVASIPGFIANYADPIGNATFGLAGKAVTKIPGVSKVFSTSAELATKLAEAKYEKELGSAMADTAYKTAARAYLSNKIKGDAVKGAAEFGAYEGAKNIAEQMAGGKPYSIADTVGATLKGAGMGSLISPSMGGLSRKFLGNPELSSATEGLVSKGEPNLDAQLANSGIVKNLEAEQLKLIGQETNLRSKLELASQKEKERLGPQLENVRARVQNLQDQRTEALSQIEQKGNTKLTQVHDEYSQKLETLSSNKIGLTSEQLAEREARLNGIARERAALEENLRVREQQVKDQPNEIFSKSTSKASKLEAQIRQGETELNLFSKLSEGKQNSPQVQSAFARANEELTALRAERDAAVAEQRVSGQRESRRRQMSDRKSAEIRDKIISLENEHAVVTDELKTGGRSLTHAERQSLESDLPKLRMQQSAIREKNHLDYHIEASDKNKLLDAISEREQVLEVRLQNPQLSNPEVGQIAVELQSLQARKASLAAEKAQVLSNFKDMVLKKEPIRFGDLNAKQEFLDKAYDTAKKTVDGLIERGIVPEETRGLLISDSLLRLQNAKGFTASGTTGLPSFHKIMLPLEVMNSVDKKHGTRLTETVLNMIRGSARYDNEHAQIASTLAAPAKALVDKGLSPDEITALFLHTESTPAGVIFNPNAVATKAITRDAYQGSIPAEQVLLQHPELAQLRTAWDAVRPDDLGERYVQGYVPIRELKGANLTGRSSTEKITDPTALKERTGGRLIPGEHETNILKLVDIYANEVARHNAYSPILPQMFGEINKLIGNNDKASLDYLTRLAGDVMNINGTAKLSEMFAGELIAQNRAQIMELLGGVEPPPTFFKELGTVLKSSMYGALVATSPKTILLQAAQPKLVGLAELGPLSQARGRTALMFDKDIQGLAESMMKELSGVDAGQLQEVGLRNIQSKVLGKIEKVISVATAPGRYIFDKAERSNRKLMFASGYLNFKEVAAKGDQAIMNELNGLLQGEKSAVLNHLKQGGVEAAAQTYGLIRSYRANFAYSIANKPQILRSELGNWIPFTTWSVNQVHRLVGDINGLVTQGSVKPLARRIAAPLLLLGAMRGLTGYNIDGGNPNDPKQLMQMFTASPLPYITSPAKAFVGTASQTGDTMQATGSFIKEAAKTIVPYYGQIAKIKRKVDGGQGAVSSFLGLQPDESEPSTRLLPKVFKGLTRPSN